MSVPSMPLPSASLIKSIHRCRSAGVAMLNIKHAAEAAVPFSPR